MGRTKGVKEKSLLLEVLKASGLNRIEFCARLGMSESCFCRYASNEYRLRLDMLPALRRAAGLSAEQIFDMVKHFYVA